MWPIIKPSALFSPKQYANLALWLDSSDLSTITKSYGTLAQTTVGGSAQSGASSFTASSTMANAAPVGAMIRLNGTDVYTITSVSTTVVGVTPNLTTTYAGGSAIAVEGVSQINDKSVNARNATQATAANQPIYVPANRNSRSTLWANGTLKTLEYANASINGIQNVTYFAVFNVDSTTTGNDCLLSWGLGTQARIEATNSAGSLLLTHQNTNKRDGVALITSTFDVWHHFNALTDGTNLVTRLDGSQTTTGAASGAWTTGAGNYALFGSNTPNRQLRGFLAEVIIYVGALTATQILLIESFLKQKWGF